MDIFVKRVTSPQEESLAGPLGRIPEEKKTAPCKLLPLKTLQWDKI